MIKGWEDIFSTQELLYKSSRDLTQSKNLENYLSLIHHDLP